MDTITIKGREYKVERPLEVTPGLAESGLLAQYQVTGARGASYLLQIWAGSHGFDRYNLISPKGRVTATDIGTIDMRQYFFARDLTIEGAAVRIDRYSKFTNRYTEHLYLPGNKSRRRVAQLVKSLEDNRRAKVSVKPTGSAGMFRTVFEMGPSRY